MFLKATSLKIRVLRAYINLVKYWQRDRPLGKDWKLETKTGPTLNELRKEQRNSVGSFGWRLMYSHGTLGQLWISFLFLKWRKTNGFFPVCCLVKHKIKVWRSWLFVPRPEINRKQYRVVRWLFLDEWVKTPKSFGYGRVN